MNATLPPSSPELATRIIGDTAERVPVPREALATRVEAELRRADVGDAMIAGEEIAARIVDSHWSDGDLRAAIAAALDRVRAEYVANAELISTVADDLAARGRASWIAQALRHRFAFDAAWEALDRLGELEHLPDDAYCASCGAELAASPEEEGS